MARPNTSTIVRAASARVPIADYWTASLVRAAHATADGGSLRMAADLCDVLLADDRVQGCMLALTRGFFGLELSFEEGVGRLRHRAHRAIEAEEDWWFALPEEELAQLVAWGVMLGIGIGHLSWVERNRRLVPRLEVWHPRHLRFDDASERWFIDTQSGEIEIAPGDGSWVMYTPGGSKRPWARGAWRGISRWWLLKRFAITDWARHSEQAGGVKVATSDSGSESDRRQLMRDLATTGADASIAMPKGWLLDVVGVTANTFETFREQVDSANAAMAIALVGQNLSTEVQGGSFAAAQVHQQVAHAVLRGQAETLSTCLHQQVLEPWAEFNFGLRSVAPWPVWDTNPPANYESLSKTHALVVTTLVEAKKAGLRIDAKAMCDEFGIELEADAQAPDQSAWEQSTAPIDTQNSTDTSTTAVPMPAP